MGKHEINTLTKRSQENRKKNKHTPKFKCFKYSLFTQTARNKFNSMSKPKSRTNH